MVPTLIRSRAHGYGPTHPYPKYTAPRFGMAMEKGFADCFEAGTAPIPTDQFDQTIPTRGNGGHAHLFRTRTRDEWSGFP